MQSGDGSLFEKTEPTLQAPALQSEYGSLFEKTEPTLQAPAEQQVEQEPAANNQPASEQVQQAQQKAVKAQQEAEALQKAAESMQEYAAVSRDESTENSRDAYEAISNKDGGIDVSNSD